MMMVRHAAPSLVHNLSRHRAERLIDIRSLQPTEPKMVQLPVGKE